MRTTLSLLLPGLVPSWAFFRSVDPSPRVEWRLLCTDQSESTWHRANTRPGQVSFGAMLVRLFWNPQWNEGLYLVSLAERLSLDPTDHSRAEIERLLGQNIMASEDTAALQFRLVFVSFEDGIPLRSVTHISVPRLLKDIACDA